jgi:cell division protein FtsB
VGVSVTKASGRRSFILVFFVVAILCFSLGLFAWLTIDSNEKQIRLDSLNAQLQQLQQENQEIDYLINNADEAELYEHLARERGYAYPDEKVYYDVTPGN